MRVAGVIFWMGVAACGAQEKKLPEAPTPARDVKVPEPQAGDALYAPLATGDKPESVKRKFDTYVVRTFGPRALVSPAFSAALKMARPPANYPREWRDGAEAFGRNYGDAFARKVTVETTRFGVSALLREDFRYRRDPNSRGFGRLTHAIGYTFVDSGDSGHRRLALANFSAAFAGGFVGNTYLPDGYNDASNGARRAGTHFAGFAVQNVLREYSPEIAAFFHKGHLPFPHLPIPVWYTKRVPGGGRP